MDHIKKYKDLPANPIIHESKKIHDGSTYLVHYDPGISQYNLFILGAMKALIASGETDPKEVAAKAIIQVDEMFRALNLVAEINKP